jgi:hypothetical protein
MKTYYNSDKCIIKEMCSFDLDLLKKKNLNQIGFILNLDKHDQPGSHWVSVYANLDKEKKKFGICYYDSIGSYPSKYVLEFMKLFKNQSKKHYSTEEFRYFKTYYNHRQHQYGNSECGMFSMIFNILCIENNHETYTKTLKRIKEYKDDEINNYRNLLYSEI